MDHGGGDHMYIYIYVYHIIELTSDTDLSCQRRATCEKHKINVQVYQKPGIEDERFGGGGGGGWRTTNPII